MKGANSVLGFGIYGGFVLLLLWWVNDLHGSCMEKAGSRGCSWVVEADPGLVLQVIAFGIVGLVGTVLVANLAFQLLRYRRSED